MFSPMVMMGFCEGNGAGDQNRGRTSATATENGAGHTKMQPLTINFPTRELLRQGDGLLLGGCRLLAVPRAWRAHVDRASEASAFGHHDARRLDVAIDGRGGDELDAIVSGNIAGQLSLNGHVARVHRCFHPRFGADAQVGGQSNFAFDRPFDHHRLATADGAVDHDIGPEERALK